jgi:hypothetical protein
MPLHYEVAKNQRKSFGRSDGEHRIALAFLFGSSTPPLLLWVK